MHIIKDVVINEIAQYHKQRQESNVFIKVADTQGFLHQISKNKNRLNNFRALEE